MSIETEQPLRGGLFIREEDFNRPTVETDQTNEIQLFVTGTITCCHLIEELRIAEQV